MAPPTLVLALAVLLQLQDPGGIFGRARLAVFDAYQRLSPRAYQPIPVRVIDVDDESLRRIGQWPWPRTTIAAMVQHLGNAGVAAIGFDMVFAEPDRTSPDRARELWPDRGGQALDALLAGLPNHDDTLAETFRWADMVVTGFVLTPGPTAGPPPRVVAGFATAGDPPEAFLPAFKGAVTNLPILEDAAKGNGAFNFTADQDLLVRRVPLVFRRGAELLPSLVTELLRVAQGAGTIVLRASGASGQTAFGERSGLNAVRVGAITLPVDATGHLRLRYTRAVPERIIPAWRLLAGEADPALLDGHIVVVGTSAAGLLDLRASPLNPAMPGFEAHVQALEQALLGDFLERPDWALGAELVGLGIVGATLIILTRRLGALPGAFAGAATLAAAAAASWFAYTQAHLLIDPVLPGVALLLVYMTASLGSYIRSEAERRQVRGAFARYLSPALVRQLAADPSRLRLGGERRTMTILFCDVRGFTTISEGFRDDPEGLTRLINRLLTPLTEELLSRRATIDKYMGDCIMAFWNAPLDDSDHAAHGCEGALAMLVALERLNRELADEAEATGEPARRLAIGIGLNTGECVVGNMGSQQRFDYSVLGDAVNLASRLEGQSKTYGVHIVIGEATRLRLNGWATLELDLIAVKGKKEPVRIHTVLGGPDRAAEPWYPPLAERHAAMLAAYRARDWDGAERLLAQCPLNEEGKMWPDLAGLYALYQDRIAAFRDDPPGAGWDGVYVATSK